MVHLTILKSGMQRWPMLREIAKICLGEGGCKKLEDSSVYICIDNKDCSTCNGSRGYTISDVDQVRLKSGQTKSKIRKQDVVLICRQLNTGIHPNADKDTPPDRLNAYITIYEKCSRAKYQGYESICFKNGELGVNGCLIPMPISNIPQETRDMIRDGKTNILVRKEGACAPLDPCDTCIKNGGKGGCNTPYWEPDYISGNKVEELLSTEEVINREVLVDQKEQKISPDELSLIETKYLSPGEKLGFNPPPETTGEEKIEISYIYGPNGSGKTYYAAAYAKEWSKMFKDWPIYLFSRRDRDKVLDLLPALKRVDIDERLVTEPLTMDNFNHSLVMFDDVDTIINAPVRKAIQQLRDDIMETGRQKMIYVINTSHLGMNWKPTRTVLNEANSYTLFPRRGNYDQNFKILKEKMGFKADVIRHIIDKPDGLGFIGKWGWVTVYRDVPQYVIYETGCELL